MILVDTGPLVALFDRKDAEHHRCVRTLKSLREPLITTIPVLTEAFHMLGPARLRNLQSPQRTSQLSDQHHAGRY